jgi:hypothetical protein
MLYSDKARDAISTASCCSFSSMSAFLMTAFRCSLMVARLFARRLAASIHEERNKRNPKAERSERMSKKEVGRNTRPSPDALILVNGKSRQDFTQHSAPAISRATPQRLAIGGVSHEDVVSLICCVISQSIAQNPKLQPLPARQARLSLLCGFHKGNCTFKHTVKTRRENRAKWEYPGFLKLLAIGSMTLRLHFLAGGAGRGQKTLSVPGISNSSSSKG